MPHIQKTYPGGDLTYEQKQNPYSQAKGRRLAELGRREEALDAIDQAIALADSHDLQANKFHLQMQRLVVLAIASKTRLNPADSVPILIEHHAYNMEFASLEDQVHTVLNLAASYTYTDHPEDALPYLEQVEALLTAKIGTEALPLNMPQDLPRFQTLSKDDFLRFQLSKVRSLRAKIR